MREYSKYDDQRRKGEPNIWRRWEAEDFAAEKALAPAAQDYPPRAGGENSESEKPVVRRRQYRPEPVVSDDDEPEHQGARFYPRHLRRARPTRHADACADPSPTAATLPVVTKESISANTAVAAVKSESAKLFGGVDAAAVKHNATSGKPVVSSTEVHGKYGHHVSFRKQ